MMDYVSLLEASIYGNGGDLLNVIKTSLLDYGATPGQFQSIKELDRISIRPNNIRLAAEGIAAEWFKSQEAKDLLSRHDWHFSVLKDREEKAGFDDQGNQKYRRYTEVRMENSKEGDKAYNVPDVLYHVTPTSNVDSILERGLEPRSSSRPDIHNYNDRIHLATSLAAAKHIMSKFNNGSDDFSILAVDSSAVNPIYDDPEFRRGGVYTNRMISPDAISVYEQPLVEIEMISDIEPNALDLADRVKRWEYGIPDSVKVADIGPYEIRKKDRTSQETFYVMFDGNPVGVMSVIKVDSFGMDNMRAVIYSYIRPEHRGNGVMTKIYELLLQDGPLVSDDIQTRHSRALWSRLANKHGARVAKSNVIGEPETDVSRVWDDPDYKRSNLIIDQLGH